MLVLRCLLYHHTRRQYWTCRTAYRIHQYRTSHPDRSVTDVTDSLTGLSTQIDCSDPLEDGYRLTWDISTRLVVERASQYRSSRRESVGEYLKQPICYGRLGLYHL
eukprot:3935282-Rhodomonas_salina.2